MKNEIGGKIWFYNKGDIIREKYTIDDIYNSPIIPIQLFNIDSIKFNAPLDYSAQNRAVTVNDYKVFVRQVFPDTAAVSVWGGEDNDPPKYGIVYISIKKNDGNALTTSKKTTIQNSLKPYNVASIRTEIVDPETIQIRLTTNYKYNSTITTRSSNEISALVTTTLNDYSTDVLNQFNAQVENQRQQFNQQNQRVIDQSNVEWRRTINTANTTITNATNQLNAQNLLNLSNFALSALWQQWRDEAAWVNTSSETELNRAHNLAIAALERSTDLDLQDADKTSKLIQVLGKFGIKTILGD